MKIELLNVRIFISKNTVVTDAIGNRRNEWQPFYTCYATASGEAGKEQMENDELRAAAQVSKAWPFEEARKLVARLER